MTGQMSCQYTTYIAATPAEVWQAITDPELSAGWWAHRNVSDWRPGSPWEHRRLDGSAVDITGSVVEADPPARLALTWANPGDGTPVAGAPRPAGDPVQPPGPSRVSIEIAPYQGIVRLTVTHDRLVGEDERDALAAGWAAVLSNLKTFLETGRPLPAPSPGDARGQPQDAAFPTTAWQPARVEGGERGFPVDAGHRGAVADAGPPLHRLAAQHRCWPWPWPRSRPPPPRPEPGAPAQPLQDCR